MDRENCRLCYYRWRNADGHHRKMHGWSFSFSGLPYLTDIARITFIKRLKFRSENCPKTIYLLKACLQRLKLGLACVPLDCVLMYQDTFSVHRDLISWKSAAIIRVQSNHGLWNRHCMGSTSIGQMVFIFLKTLLIWELTIPESSRLMTRYRLLYKN